MQHACSTQAQVVGGKPHQCKNELRPRMTPLTTPHPTRHHTLAGTFDGLTPLHQFEEHDTCQRHAQAGCDSQNVQTVFARQASSQACALQDTNLTPSAQRAAAQQHIRHLMAFSYSRSPDRTHDAAPTVSTPLKKWRYTCDAPNSRASLSSVTTPSTRPCSSSHAH